MSSPVLTGAQKTYLRGLGQTRSHALTVGKAGLTPEFFRELEALLTGQELVKLRFAGADRHERAALCEAIAAKTESLCVGTVGHTALFYREQADENRRVIHWEE